MNTKTTAILALVCVAVFAYLLFVVKPFSEKAAPTEKAAKAQKALLDPKPEGTDRIELTSRGKPFVFVRDGKEDWKLTAPIEAGASKFEVDALLDAVTAMKVDKEYDKDSPQRPGNAVSGLDKPQATVKLAKGDKVLADVRIGTRVPTGRGNYVQLTGKDAIYVSVSDLDRLFTKRLDDYRDKRVLKFNFDDVQKVKVEGLRNFELVKAAGEEWTTESPLHAQADKSEADKLLRPLTNLRADQFIDDAPKSLKLYGLDNPRLKISVETKETTPAKAEPGEPGTKPADTQPVVETKTYVLLIGASADPKEESYYAQIGGKPWVFSIRQDTYKTLSPTETAVRDKAIARVEANKVKKVEAVTPGGDMVLFREADGKWRFADNTEADATLVGNLIKTVANMRATDFVDLKKELLVLDWNKPRAKVVLTLEGQVNPVSVLVGPASASGKMVYVRNQAQEGVAAVPENQVLQLLQAPVSYRNRRVMAFDKDDAVEIQIDRNINDQPAPPVRLFKSKNTGKWQMVEPVAGPSEESAVSNLLQDLSSLSARRVVAMGDKAKYGLDKPGVTVAVTMKAADVPYVQAMPEVKPQPASAPAQAAASSRPTTMAATAPASGPARDVAILKQLIEYQKTNPNENPMATEMLKKRLADLQASMPAEAAASTPAASAPAAVAAASRPAPAPAPAPAAGKVYQLLMIVKDGVTYACQPDSDAIYELDNKIVDDALVEMYDCQITQFDPADVTEAAFKNKVANITLRKVGNDWKYIEDPLVQVDASKVSDVLTAFKDLKTHRYTDYHSTDLAKHGLAGDVDRVSFALKNGRKIEILCSDTIPANDKAKTCRNGVVAGTDKVFHLRLQDQIPKFRQRIEDFQKRPGADRPSPGPGPE